MRRLRDLIRRLLELMGPSGVKGTVGIMGLLFIGAAFDTIALAVMLPFLSLLTDPDAALPGRLGALLESWTAGSDRNVLIQQGALALVCLYLVKNTYLAMVTALNYRFVYRVHLDLAVRLFAGYMRAPWAFVATRNSSTFIRNITEQVRHTVSEVVIPLIWIVRESLVILAFAAYLFWLQPVITLLLVLGFGGLGATFLYAIARQSRRMGEIQLRESGQLLQWLNQGFGGFKQTRILGVEGFFIERFTEAELRYVTAVRFNRTAREMPRFLIETLAIGAMLSLAILLARMEQGTSSVLPTLGVFALAALRTLPSANHIVGNITTILHFGSAVEAIHTDLQRLASLDDPVPPETRIPRLQQSLTVTDLHFSYPESDRPALSNINMTIARGESVAFVGPSGAGKSTLVDMLLALHRPSAGSVLVDGVDIYQNSASWQKQVGYVPQMIYLTDDTIRRNVAFGLPDDQIDDAQVHAALRMAQLEPLIASLPQGLDTPVGEQGVRLSGGQRQRLGIARALYPDPAILVLDEATAAVDNETEHEISRSIEAISGSKTVLTIAHRLGTVRRCTRIYFIDDGHVTGAGSYEELCATHPGFRRMVEVQAQDGDQVAPIADASGAS